MDPKTLKTLSAALVVLVAATAAAVLYQRPGRAPTFAPQSIREKASRLELEGPAGRLELKKQGSGWVASSPEGYPADAAAVAALLQKLPEARVSEPLTEDPERYALFGFAASSPTRVRVYEGEDPKPRLDFEVGGDGPDYPSAFVRPARQSGVLQLSGVAAGELTKAPGEWLARSVVGLEPGAVVGVRAESAKAKWELKRSSSQWQLNGTRLTELAGEKNGRPVFDAAARLEADAVVSSADAPVKTIDKPELSLEVRTASGAVVLRFGRKDEQGRRWAQRDGETRVRFLVADWKLDPFRKSPAEFSKI